jgi:hypothetical protein
VPTAYLLGSVVDTTTATKRGTRLGASEADSWQSLDEIIQSQSGLAACAGVSMTDSALASTHPLVTASLHQ